MILNIFSYAYLPSVNLWWWSILFCPFLWQIVRYLKFLIVLRIFMYHRSKSLAIIVPISFVFYLSGITFFHCPRCSVECCFKYFVWFCCGFRWEDKSISHCFMLARSSSPLIFYKNYTIILKKLNFTKTSM